MSNSRDGARHYRIAKKTAEHCVNTAFAYATGITSSAWSSQNTAPSSDGSFDDFKHAAAITPKNYIDGFDSCSDDSSVTWEEGITQRKSSPKLPNM